MYGQQQQQQQHREHSSDNSLTLIEGSNGLRLVCQANGEPQVQFRWFHVQPVLSGPGALPAESIVAEANSNDLAAAAAATTTTAAAGTQLVELAATSTGTGAGNNRHSDDPDPGGSVAVSTLDLSARPMDRKQAGHYICEASNALGRKRRTLYANVLCKYSILLLRCVALSVSRSLLSIGCRQEQRPTRKQRQQPLDL